MHSINYVYKHCYWLKVSLTAIHKPIKVVYSFYWQLGIMEINLTGWLLATCMARGNLMYLLVHCSIWPVQYIAMFDRTFVERDMTSNFICHVIWQHLTLAVIKTMSNLTLAMIASVAQSFIWGVSSVSATATIHDGFLFFIKLTFNPITSVKATK